MLSPYMERIRHMSSTQVARLGNSSLTSVPHSPYFLNLYGEASRFPVRVRSSFGRSNGNALPLSVASRGLGSNKSTCDGPPDMNRKITRSEERRVGKEC